MFVLMLIVTLQGPTITETAHPAERIRPVCGKFPYNAENRSGVRSLKVQSGA